VNGHIGAPEDEYDAEVRDLIKWRKAVTADMAARIADGISQTRAGHMPI
jgi:plasmid maintenance system antidote protein VapI